MRTCLITLLALFLCLRITSAAEKTADEHVAAIRQIGQILAEYTQKKQSTPYSENWKNDDPNDDSSPVTIICNLSKNKIPDKLAYPPFSCYLESAEEFEKYLSKALGRQIKLPRDDRNLTHKGELLPLFYLIQIEKDSFFVSTYLTEPRKETRKVSADLHKFEVGSVAVPEKKIEKATPPATSK